MQKITVYSVPGCYKCRKLMSDIKKLGLNFTEVDCLKLENPNVSAVPSLQIDENPPIYAGDLPLSKLKEILTP